MMANQVLQKVLSTVERVCHTPSLPVGHRWLVIMMVAGLSMVSTLLHAADVPFEFKTPEQEQRYKDLTEQLRCLVCQNQSLADSHAELAQDLRNEVYQMVMQGQSDREIVDFLVKRYGDFVLFKPPLRIGTILLWSGPFLMLLGALLFMYRHARRNAGRAPPEISDADQHRLAALLQESPDGEKD